MCLAQGPQRSDAGEARTRGPLGLNYGSEMTDHYLNCGSEMTDLYLNYGSEMTDHFINCGSE